MQMHTYIHACMHTYSAAFHLSADASALPCHISRRPALQMLAHSLLFAARGKRIVRLHHANDVSNPVHADTSVLARHLSRDSLYIPLDSLTLSLTVRFRPHSVSMPWWRQVPCELQPNAQPHHQNQGFRSFYGSGMLG